MVELDDIKYILEQYIDFNDYIDIYYLHALGMDEIDWFDMCVDLERKYHIKFTDEDDFEFLYNGMRVRRLVELINEKLNNHE